MEGLSELSVGSAGDEPGNQELPGECLWFMWGSGVLSLLSRTPFCGSAVAVAAQWQKELLICVTSCEIHCSDASF